jgi:hypothetical protein
MLSIDSRRASTKPINSAAAVSVACCAATMPTSSAAEIGPTTGMISRIPTVTANSTAPGSAKTGPKPIQAIKLV